MNNLIYFSTSLLSLFDQHLQDHNYKHHHWFDLQHILEWPAHLTSRVHALQTPWSLAPTTCPVPNPATQELKYDRVIETIADEFCKNSIRSQRRPYIYWSGGIDSTSILVSLLKVANSDFLKNMVVLCDQNSIDENAYFYHKFLHNNVTIESPNSFRITQNNHKHSVIVDGEAGNQCLGWRSINVLAYHRRFDLLDQPWSSVKKFSDILPGCTNFAVDLISESIKHAPIPIESVYDFLWWTAFNFKFDDVLLRKSHTYTQNLTADMAKEFYQQGVVRFYAHPLMQQWSMQSKDLRRETVRIMGKYHAKRYIYEFDQNELWYVNKKEESSDSKIFYDTSFALYGDPIFAVDQDWNRYSLANPEHRKQLGKILQRT